ncbi:hypothetical protein SLT36_11990 [Aminobacter sp. BA135]|uniref:hypothetical protein n=1 Tax=Aminobacter sp. BA135 TaxID=537596 RepID=UPI003D797129
MSVELINYNMYSLLYMQVKALGEGMPIMKRLLGGLVAACSLACATGPSLGSETGTEFDAVQGKLSPTNTMTCPVRWADLTGQPEQPGEEVMPFLFSYIDGELWFRGVNTGRPFKGEKDQREVIFAFADRLLEEFGGRAVADQLAARGGDPKKQIVLLDMEVALAAFATLGETKDRIVRCERYKAPERFDRALEAMGQSGPAIMTYTCRISGNQVLGVPVIIGREQFHTVSISIAEDAIGSVNGTVLEPVHIQYAENGDVASVVYDARQFQQAMTSSATAQSMGMDQQSFDGLKALMKGAVDQSMGDRRRFVSIALDQDAITFFDLDANDQPTSQAVGNCARGM